MMPSLAMSRSGVVLVVLVLAACRSDDAAPRPAAHTPARDAGAPMIGHAERPLEVVTRFHANRACRLALDDDGYAYVTELFGNQVFKVRLADGASTVLYHSPSRGSWGIAVRGDDVLWSSNDTGCIYAAPRSGAGPIRVVAEGLTGIGSFRIAGETLYWADVTGAAPGTVWKRPLAGGPSVGIATPGARADDLLVDDGRLLVAGDRSDVLAVGSDGTVAPWFTAPDQRFTSLAEDDRYVYAATVAGQLLRIAKDTRAADYLIDGKVFYESVTVGRDRLYVLDYANPALLGLPR